MFSLTSRSRRARKRILRYTEGVRAPAHPAPLALEHGVGSAEYDRLLGEWLESVCELSRPKRLRLRWRERVRDTASESLPELVAGSFVADAVRSGALADRIRGEALR